MNMKKVFTLFLLLLCVATGWATNYKVAATYTPLSELTSGYYVIRVFSDKANAEKVVTFMPMKAVTKFITKQRIQQVTTKAVQHLPAPTTFGKYLLAKPMA